MIGKLLSLWPWGLGLLGVAILVGAILSPVAALKLAKEVGGFVLDRARAGIKRLRQVKDWWRVSAIVMALVCVAFAFAITDAKREIVLVREQCETRIVTVERQAEQAVTAANTSRAGLQQCKARLQEEVGRAARAAELERVAVAAAAAAAAQAKRDREEWQQTYRTRPANCQAALEAVEASCPTLSDY